MSDTKIGTTAQKFFAENAKMQGENPNKWTVSQGDMKKFMNGQGLTDDIIAKTAEVEGEILSGAVAFNNGKIVDAIAAEKKAGRSGDNAVTELKYRTPKCTTVVKATAKKTYIVPGKPDAKSEKYNVVKLVKEITHFVEPQVIADGEEAVKKALAGE